jgi:hypothetical protein
MSAPNDWNPAVWIALASLALTLLGTIVLGAFYVGKHSNRIETLESGQKALTEDVRKTRDEASKARAEQAGFAASLLALKDTVDNGFEDVKRTIRDSLSSRRRRGADDIA